MNIDTKTFIDALYDKYKNGKLVQDLSPVVLHSLQNKQLVEIDAINAFNIYLWHLADMQQSNKAVSVVMFYTLKPPQAVSYYPFAVKKNNYLMGFSIFPSHRYRKGNFILEEGVRVHYITAKEQNDLKVLKIVFPNEFSYRVDNDIDDEFVIAVSIDCSQIYHDTPYDKLPLRHCHFAEFDRFRETFSVHSLCDAKILHLVTGIGEDLEFDILGALEQEWNKFKLKLPETKLTSPDIQIANNAANNIERKIG